MPRSQRPLQMSKLRGPAAMKFALLSFFQRLKSCRLLERQQQHMEHPPSLGCVRSSLLISTKVSLHLWICQCRIFHFCRIGMRSSMAVWTRMITNHSADAVWCLEWCHSVRYIVQSTFTRFCYPQQSIRVVFSPRDGGCPSGRWIRLIEEYHSLALLCSSQ